MGSILWTRLFDWKYVRLSMLPLIILESCFPTLDEVKAYVKKYPTQQKFLRISNNLFFNVPCYKNRIRITIETFLFDANDRAANFHQGPLNIGSPSNSLKNFAYCHLVGLGLGVWELVCDSLQLYSVLI